VPGGVLLLRCFPGLTWETILKKRDNRRAAFDGFDPAASSLLSDGRVYLSRSRAIRLGAVEIPFLLIGKAAHVIS
jgi:hypothetical protein